MKYSDGQLVKLGDEVDLWKGCCGVVVCSLDDNEYSSDYPRAEWEYLKSGVLIQTDKGGLFHFIEMDEDARLKKRATKRGS